MVAVEVGKNEDRPWTRMSGTGRDIQLVSNYPKGYEVHSRDEGLKRTDGSSRPCRRRSQPVLRDIRRGPGRRLGCHTRGSSFCVWVPECIHGSVDWAHIRLIINCRSMARLDGAHLLTEVFRGEVVDAETINDWGLTTYRALRSFFHVSPSSDRSTCSHCLEDREAWGRIP